MFEFDNQVMEIVPVPVKINTSEAPAPFSKYSQAMRVSAGKDLVFVSGQVGVDLEPVAVADVHGCSLR